MGQVRQDDTRFNAENQPDRLTRTGLLRAGRRRAGLNAENQPDRLTLTVRMGADGEPTASTLKTNLID